MEERKLRTVEDHNEEYGGQSPETGINSYNQGGVIPVVRTQMASVKSLTGKKKNPLAKETQE